jgi:hypothetical protein
MFRLQLQIAGWPSFLAALCAGGLFLVGCAAEKSNVLSGTTGGWYSVSVEQTPFYHYGPQQGNGPDEQLPKDSLMKVIRPSFGYVKVQLQNGQDGYVASEDIRPATAALVTEKLSPPAPVVAEHSAHGEQFDLDTSDPRLIAPPEPLPQASATPKFRY